MLEKTTGIVDRSEGPATSENDKISKTGDKISSSNTATFSSSTSKKPTAETPSFPSSSLGHKTNVKNDTAHIKTCTTSPSSPKPEQHESETSEKSKNTSRKVSKQTCQAALVSREEKEQFCSEGSGASKKAEEKFIATEKVNNYNIFVEKEKVTNNESFSSGARRDEKKHGNGGLSDDEKRKKAQLVNNESRVTNTQLELINTLRRMRSLGNT